MSFQLSCPACGKAVAMATAILAVVAGKPTPATGQNVPAAPSAASGEAAPQKPPPDQKVPSSGVMDLADLVEKVEPSVVQLNVSLAADPSPAADLCSTNRARS